MRSSRCAGTGKHAANYLNCKINCITYTIRKDPSTQEIYPDSRDQAPNTIYLCPFSHWDKEEYNTIIHGKKAEDGFQIFASYPSVYVLR